MKLVWENSNPNNSFESQTLSLNLSDYEAVAVVFRYASTAQTHNTQIAPLGTKSAGYILTSGEVNEREFTPSTSGINFGIGRYVKYGSSWNTKNDYMVPIAVYGIY